MLFVFDEFLSRRASWVGTSEDIVTVGALPDSIVSVMALFIDDILTLSWLGATVRTVDFDCLTDVLFIPITCPSWLQPNANYNPAVFFYRGGVAPDR